ncbi:ABC transporter ATP-binding protein, partial [Streptomyces tanashiensis]
QLLDPELFERPHQGVPSGEVPVQLAPDAARAAVAAVTGGAAFAALDDFTLATPSLEDVYLALGGATEGLVKA